MLDEAKAAIYTLGEKAKKNASKLTSGGLNIDDIIRPNCGIQGEKGFNMDI
jgi:hypothetical protein